jgi:hypothetical protein
VQLPSQLLPQPSTLSTSIARLTQHISPRFLLQSASEVAITHLSNTTVPTRTLTPAIGLVDLSPNTSIRLARIYTRAFPVAAYEFAGADFASDEVMGGVEVRRSDGVGEGVGDCGGCRKGYEKEEGESGFHGASLDGS